MFYPICPLKLQTGNLTLRNWVRFARFTPGRATPHTTTAFAHMPQSPQVWLRFARFPPSPAAGRAKLGSFCTIRLFVGWASPPDFLPWWLKLGSFCMIGPRPPGPRATRPRRELGLFCTFVLRRAKLGSFCALRPPHASGGRPRRRRPAHVLSHESSIGRVGPLVL
jgi:hypothetical protein